MFWKLFREIGLYSDSYGDLEAKRIDASLLNLDPVSVAGHLNISLLKRRCQQDHMRCKVGFALPALQLITEDIPEDYFDLDHSTQRFLKRYTSRKWLKHLNDLEEASMLISVAYRHLHHVAYYFAVPKNETKARAIWNGRELTKRTPTAPPVNLPQMSDIIRRLMRLSRNVPSGGSFQLMTADFRHYFHTIRVSESLSRYFGVVTETDNGVKAYRWSTLPMGWGPSPWVASSCGLAAILWHEKDEEELFLIPHGLEQLPTFIDIVGGGFICLYYDNILVAHTDPNVMQRVKARLERNFGSRRQPGLHVVCSDVNNDTGNYVNFPRNNQNNYIHHGLRLLAGLKQQYSDGFDIPMGAPLEIHTSKKLRNPLTPAIYLGVAFGISTKRVREEVGGLRYRQCAKKHDKWKLLDADWGKLFTARELASYIGKILWRHSISLRPLCALAPVISILRRLARERIENKQSWDDAFFRLDEGEAMEMTKQWGIVLENQWHETYDSDTKRHRVRLVSDSSDHQWGYLVFTEDGDKAYEKGLPWSTSLAQRHIFIKELCAAIFAIRYALASRPKSLEIHIGIDNTAAAAALRNMYSGNVMACQLLDQLSTELTAHDARLYVYGLRSEDNASDAASRGRKATDEEVANTFAHLLAQEKGHRLGIPADFMQRIGVGHREPFEEHDTVIETLLEAEDPQTGESN